MKPVPECEEEILYFLWEAGESRTAREIMEYFNGEAGKTWKKQTMNTFLVRLRERGILGTDMRGTKRVYGPLLSKVEYEQKKAENILRQFYGGSLSAFLSALAGGKNITAADTEELKTLLESC